MKTLTNLAVAEAFTPHPTVALGYQGPFWTAVEADVDQLVADTNRSLGLAARRYWPNTPAARLAAVDLMAKFTRVTALVESLGWTAERIKEAFAPCRKVFAESAFMRRCQEWPRGYAGDFETIEYLVSAVNRSEAGTLGWLFEQILLESPATQQHRNKLKCQTAEIVNALEQRPGARIFSLACGGCLDWFAALPALHDFRGEIVLNDCEPAALELAASRLATVTERYSLAPGNILRVAGRMAQAAKFDLAIAGGLFDYLSDRAIVSLLRTLHGRLLASGGVLLFTNMAKGNNWRTLMEYGSDWPIIERSEEQVALLCAEAGMESSEVEITRDETDLTLLVKVTRRACMPATATL